MLMFTDTAASKVTAAHLGKIALLYVRQSTIRQALHTTEAELHFIKARLRGGVLSKARRGELITPLPVGLVHDATGRVVLDPDTAVRAALTHLFATFEATGSATACVKAFAAAGLSFPWRH